MALSHFERKFPMKRLLLVLCLVVLPYSLLAADSTLDGLLVQARVLRQAGKSNEAIPVAQQAAALAEKQQDWQHLNDARRELSFDYRLSHDYDRVLQLRLANLQTARKYSKAFADATEEERSSVQAVAAAYSWKHDYANAIRYCREELSLTEAMSRTKTVGTLLPYSLQRLGINLYLAGQLPEAEQRMRQAYAKYVEFVNQGWDPRMVERFQLQVELLRWLSRVQVAQRRYEDALETTELARSRAFAGAMANRLTGQVKALADPSLARIRTTAREHNATLVEYSVLYDYDPDLLFVFSNLEDIPITTVYIWVVQPNGRITFHESPLSPQGPSLVQMVRDARRSVGAFGRGLALDPDTDPPETEPLQHLYDLLIAPIASDLPREPERVVTVIPQDWLFMVPFAALKDSERHYLVEQHTINYAPSATILDLTHQELSRHPGGKGILVVGNPAMPTFIPDRNAKPIRLNQLPKAEAEARTIASKFHATPFVGPAATKDEVLRRILKAQIVHLATHGLLDQKNGGLQGALALAPTPDDSGFLTVLELQSLNLNADLVVLSACDTALGKLSGDGVMGFSRAFLIAGTSSLIVSLWSIPDDSTAYLMEHFYQRLQRGEDKAQSLRGAMLDTKQKFPNPGSWAAFSLQGESAVAPASRNVAGNPDAITKEQLNLIAFSPPIPPNALNLSQTPNRDPNLSAVDVMFSSTMTLPELFKYYKTAMENRGLKSVGFSERIDDRSFGLVFRGPWGDREISVGGSDFSSIGTNVRSVILTFNLRRDDDAEFSPADNERLAGIVIPPHATGLRVNQKFQTAEEKADIFFLTALSADQVSVLYNPQLKKMGFVEYPAGTKRNADSLTLEFHRPGKGRALFVSIEKSFSHPERKEVKIRFDKPSA
jgi:CHAT domain-containing protein